MGMYDEWDRFFRAAHDDEFVLDFARLETLLGLPMPASARRHAAWWSSSQPHAVWSRYGFRASPDLRRERARFRRLRPKPVPAAQAVVRPTSQRLILLGCVKTKLPYSAPAKDLYISALWHKRRAYAEVSGQPWLILSAEHGLLHPNDVIEPYDRHLRSQTPVYQREWSAKVTHAVLNELDQLTLNCVEFHASSAYVEGVSPRLEAAGITVVWPFEGLTQGQHLAWYEDHAGWQPACLTEAVEVEAEAWEWPRLLEAKHIGAFEHRWPDAVEAFDHGWEGLFQWGGRDRRFRHGVGGRVVYGRFRAHTVTWMDGEPRVEGVAADDYEVSLGLLSLIKGPDRATIRSPSEVNRAYRRFQVVDHRSEIDAPYSRNGMAVKIRVDDLPAWIAHALLRGGPVPPSPQDPAIPIRPPELDPEDRAEILATTAEARSLEEKMAVARHLLAFAAEPAQLPAVDGIPDFTPIRAANEMLARDPFAFLIAVIADYQIPAERAWSLPYLLKQRLGHLDPVRMLAEQAAVAEAIARRPSLHRYIRRVPEFILAACRILMEGYGGDAGEIWANEPRAADLQRRLRAFPGISQKKAAMAVEILERDMGVPIRDLSGSDIAFDVHVRRVFLRTGIAERDDADHMISVARRLHPERPGALDWPSWVVGRTWCHPANPDCRSCVLDPVCAHRIDIGSRVRGA